MVTMMTESNPEIKEEKNKKKDGEVVAFNKLSLFMDIGSNKANDELNLQRNVDIRTREKLAKSGGMDLFKVSIAVAIIVMILVISFVIINTYTDNAKISRDLNFCVTEREQCRADLKICNEVGGPRILDNQAIKGNNQGGLLAPP